MAIPLVCRFDDRGRRHDANFKTRDSLLREPELFGRRPRDVEFALTPIGPGVVDPDNSRIAILRIANNQDGAVGIDGARGAIGVMRAKCFSGRRQPAWIGRIVPAVIIVGGLDDLIGADNGNHLGNA
jgi:hypothetical protein